VIGILCDLRCLEKGSKVQNCCIPCAGLEMPEEQFNKIPKKYRDLRDPVHGWYSPDIGCLIPREYRPDGCNNSICYPPDNIAH